MIVRRRHFYDIHTDEINRSEATDNTERLRSREAAANRCTGAGCESRIETVDVKSQIGCTIPHNPFNFGDDRIGAMAVCPSRIQNMNAHKIIIPSANTDLHRVPRINQTVPDSFIKHRAVIQ